MMIQRTNLAPLYLWYIGAHDKLLVSVVLLALQEIDWDKDKSSLAKTFQLVVYAEMDLQATPPQPMKSSH